MKTLRQIAALIAVLILIFAPLLAVIPAFATETLNGEVWEGQTISLTAPEGYYFSGVNSSYYGAPNDPNCGTYNQQQAIDAFVGKTTGTLDANNGVFGDPCPGVYKIYQLSLFVAQVVVPTPTPTPTPTRTPRPRPTSTYTPPPVTPEETPTPTVEPTPEPTPTVVPTPSITPTEVPTVEPTPTPPAPTEEPTPAPTQSSKPTSEPGKEVTVSAPTPEPSSTSEVTPVVPSSEPTASPEVVVVVPVLGDVGKAISEGIEAFNSIGTDMSPEVRKKAQKQVVASIILTQVAQTAVAAAAAGRRK